MKNHLLTDKELDKESWEDNFPRYIGRKIVGWTSIFGFCLQHPHASPPYSAASIQGLTLKEFCSFINLMWIELLLYVIGKVSVS